MTEFEKQELDSIIDAYKDWNKNRNWDKVDNKDYSLWGPESNIRDSIWSLLDWYKGNNFSSEVPVCFEYDMSRPYRGVQCSSWPRSPPCQRRRSPDISRQADWPAPKSAAQRQTFRDELPAADAPGCGTGRNDRARIRWGQVAGIRAEKGSRHNANRCRVQSNDKKSTSIVI